MMFKEPIKPMWEDENNKNGGKISIKLRKEYTNKNELIHDLEKINFNDGKKMAIIVLDDKTKNLYGIIKNRLKKIINK